MLYVWILDAMERLDTWMWNNENHFTTQIEMVSFVSVILTCFKAPNSISSRFSTFLYGLKNEP